MTLGEKIRKYRTMKGLTQQELGLKVGFSAATADSRIRKYERDVMAPKDDIRRRLADVLDVDMSALSDIDISSELDIMQVLFFLEEEYGLELVRTKDKTSIVFDNDNPKLALLLSYIYTWSVHKKNLPSGDDEASYEADLKYRKWKARFPKDVNHFWDAQRKAIDEKYEILVAKISSTHHKIQYLSEFLILLRKLVEVGISIETGHRRFGVGDGGLILTFSTSQLINTNSRSVERAFAEFLYDINTMKEYGMPYYIDLSTDEAGTKISYTLRWSALGALGIEIEKIQEHEKNKSALSDFEIEMFEDSFNNKLSQYKLNLKEELSFRYGKN